MKPGDLVRPLVIFRRGTVGVIISGPSPSRGAFGVREGSLYEVLIDGGVSFLFDYELAVIG
jgi:hypothetical protein